MQTFAAPVFSKVRRSLDMSEAEYMSSICSVGCYLQFVSNSKSRADFFVTNDRRFFLKTQSEREVRFLLTNLHRYIEHLEKYPHSLLVRFLGKSFRSKYFLVMQSVFYPDERIKSRYDIKGCEVGRWTDPETEGHTVFFKTTDLYAKPFMYSLFLLLLGGEKSWFERQVEVDTAFLRSLNVLDYSLLLGHQPLQPRRAGPSDTRSAPTQSSETSMSTTDDCCPDAKNAVHVIDGPQLRYFVGIIDIFHRVRLQEETGKPMEAPPVTRAGPSLLSAPNKYCQRFCRWIQGTHGVMLRQTTVHCGFQPTNQRPTTFNTRSSHN
uniref:Phosphatidylinositol-4-phosphate 5-kinase like 1 n=1 Tax=Gouania willdenowi TaxID=441366 RepID=A0A8C5DKC9_GOUWI